MSTSLYWQTLGSGPDLVMIHGWGMNGAVWQQAAEQLSQHFTLHIVDLPGYGHSAESHGEDLADIANQVLAQAPEKATWLGWSLGGLVASYVAIHHPNRVNKLITVASSPKFAAEKASINESGISKAAWRGIQPQVLTAFTDQLIDDFKLTVERFMALQAMGSPSARQDVKQLKQAVFSRPEPNPRSLLAGLKILAEVDLRDALEQIQSPMLRLYGRLDGLVPLKVSKELNLQLPHTECFVFSESSHAPFMTEHQEFCAQVSRFAL
ncbi:pimeloyl-ACP methyl ester esterase BioH [Vibrio maerlii]|uniref:pimeloyl-ACP methyl ester esterase BioH n=1 Tax=Vibrio maerlii TaxID=2231648 RepID=UPI000E3BD8B2|nr:pimeloyl-ACP methyl ester esterase BioH [Vibrio maerlii]